MSSKGNVTTEERLLRAERRSRGSRISRWIASPIRYPVSLLFNRLLYPWLKREWTIKVQTFFGVPMWTALPSGTDIWLNGIKSHDSEIRLSRFLVQSLRQGDVFLDVGAHFGYYSLLASTRVGPEGLVIALEPSTYSFQFLQRNSARQPNIRSYQRAAGESPGEITFYEYPGPYAEYNTIIAGAYTAAPWYPHVKESINRVERVRLDDLLDGFERFPSIIKVDVEGGELQVLQGLENSLIEKNPVLILEYLVSAHPENPHALAEKYLTHLGFSPFRISPEGTLEKITDAASDIQSRHLDSDNLVFTKQR